MSVLKRGNSKYWYVQFQFQGRTYIKSSKTTDKKLAEAMEAEWKQQLLRQNILGIREHISVRDALSLYCESKLELKSYKHIVRHASKLNNLLPKVRFLHELTTQDLERLKLDQQRQGYANQTIKHVMNVMNGALNYAKKMGYLVSDLEFPKIRLNKGKLRYLTFEEEKKLLKAIDPYREHQGLAPYSQRDDRLKKEMHDLYDFIILLLDTGARYTEIASLEWNRVNLDDKSISLWRPKVKNESILFMTDRVFEILSRRSNSRQSTYIFTNRNGQARGYNSHPIRQAFKRAGIQGCSAHTLRHTHASRLIQNGLTIYEVKEILGHSDIKTTMRYAHLEQKSISKKARELIDRLNKENNKIELRLVK